MKRLLFTALLAGAVLLSLTAQAQRGMSMGGGARGGSFGGARGGMTFSAPRGGGFASPARGNSGFMGRTAPGMRTFSTQPRVFSSSRFTPRTFTPRTFSTFNNRFFNRSPFFFNNRFNRFGFNRFNNFGCFSGFAFCNGFGFGGFGFGGLGFGAGLLGYPFDYGFDGFGYGNGYGYGQQPQQAQVAVSDNSGANLELTQQVEHLSDELQIMQEQQYAQNQQRFQPPSRPASQSAREPIQNTTLVFHDGRQLSVQNYAIAGKTIWVFSESSARKYPMSDLDVAATEQANARNGVEFRAP